MASSQLVDNSGPVTSKVSVKQEPGVVAAATVPKLTIKSEALERTVVAQTLSTTLVHVSELPMLLKKLFKAYSNNEFNKS